MASRSTLPSDPTFLLEYIDELPNESDSDDDFDGYLEPEEGPRVTRTEDARENVELGSPSVDDAVEPIDDEESPLAGSSPSPVPMQGNYSNGSPLASSSSHSSPSPSPAAATPGAAPSTSSTSPSQVNIDTIKYCKMTQCIYVKQPPVFTASPGVAPGLEGKSPVEFFRLFFCSQVLSLIQCETNRYAQQYLEKKEEYLRQHPKARAKEWIRAPLVLKELEVFLAIIIAMGICGFPTLRYKNSEACNKS